MGHVAEFGLSYGTKEEFNFRLAQYGENDKKIKEINANGSNTFLVGHNQFSTWTGDEYKRILGDRVDPNP